MFFFSIYDQNIYSVCLISFQRAEPMFGKEFIKIVYVYILKPIYPNIYI